MHIKVQIIDISRDMITATKTPKAYKFDPSNLVFSSSSDPSLWLNAKNAQITPVSFSKKAKQNIITNALVVTIFPNVFPHAHQMTLPNV